METGLRKVDALELKKLAELYKRPVGFFTGEAAEDVSFGTDVKHLARQVAELSPDDREEFGAVRRLPARQEAEEGRLSHVTTRRHMERRVEADRLHKKYDTEARAKSGEGRIDVFGMLVDSNIPVMFRAAEEPAWGLSRRSRTGRHGDDTAPASGAAVHCGP